MNEANREALNRAGFRVGTVQEFLGLSDWEAEYIDLKLRLRMTARRLREEQALSQQEAAKRIGSSQSRIAKLEAGSPDVSMDLLVRYLLAVGGRLDRLDALKAAEAADGGPARNGVPEKPVRPTKPRARRVSLTAPASPAAGPA